MLIKRVPILFFIIIPLLVVAMLVGIMRPSTIQAAPTAMTIINVTTTVDEYGNGADCSIREAIQTVNTGSSFGGCTTSGGVGSPHTIVMPSGTYGLTRTPASSTNATGNLTLVNSVVLTITGAGAGQTIIDANGIDRVFRMGSGFVDTGEVVISDMTIRNGYTPINQIGGGIYTTISSLTLIDTQVISNSADQSGGGVYVSGGTSGTSFTMLGGELKDNVVRDTWSGKGGGIQLSIVATSKQISGVLVDGNFAAQGGGIYFGGYPITLTDMLITNNTASGGGGVYNNGAKVTIDNSTISDNTALASHGGGINNYAGMLTVTNSVFSGNTVSTTIESMGGGIYNDYTGVLVVADSTFTNNSAFFGGGIRNGSRPANPSYVTTATITNSIFSGNTVSGGGGGMANSGIATVSNSTFSNNIAHGDHYGPGTSGTGGAFQSQDSDAANSIFTNVTFSGNQANGSIDDGGGAIAVYQGDIILNSVTMVGNSTTTHGGAVALPEWATAGSTLSSRNSIVANNTATVSGNNCSDLSTKTGAEISSGGFNLDNGITCGFSGPGDMQNTSPQMKALANNGGTTETHVPQSNSPVIDAGNCAGVAADQRNNVRNDYKCDIGAVELQFSDSDTVSKSIVEGRTYTFGPTLAKITVVDDGNGCLTGLEAQREDVDHPNAKNDNLKTGVHWNLTPVTGCADPFIVTLTLPTPYFTPDPNDKLCRYDTSISDFDCGGTNAPTNPIMNDGSTISAIVRTGIGSFSDWTAGNNVDPTAVSLQSISAASNTPLLPMAAVTLFLIVIGGVALRQRQKTAIQS